MTDHPMTPPTELLKQWEDDWFQEQENADVLLVNAYAAGALAGADAELEACCELLDKEINSGWGLARQIRATRRPKPPSLKEQALDQLSHVEDRYGVINTDYIRRALEQLDD